MIWEFSPFAMPLLIGIALMLAIMATAWQRRSIPGTGILLALGITAMTQAAGYTLEIGTPDAATTLTSFKIQYLGAPVTPLVAYMLVQVYTGAKRHTSPLYYTILFSFPALTIGLALTNELHGLIWQNIEVVDKGQFYASNFDHGSWYWVNAIYIWIVSFWALFLLARSWRRMTGLYRRQTTLLLLGVATPLVFYISYLMGLWPDGLDPTAFGLCVAAVIIAWGILYFRLTHIMPVAHEAVFSSMKDAVIVIDTMDNLVDLNPVARQLFNLDARPLLIGQPASVALRHWYSLLKPYLEQDEASDALTFSTHQGEYTFDMRLSTLRTYDGQQQGRLIVLRDITDRVTAEEALLVNNENLRTLHRFDGELNNKLDTHYVMETALRAAVFTSKGEAAVIGKHEEAGLHICYRYKDETITKDDRLIENDTPALKQIIESSRPKISTNVNTIQTLFPNHSNGAVAILPLISNDVFIGVMAVYTEITSRFTADDSFDMLQLLAARVAVALDNAQMYEERTQLVSELDAYAHTVAHDLKGPLSIVTSYGSLLQQVGAVGDDDSYNRWLNAMVRNAFKSVDIINALLMMARIRQSDKPPTEELSMDPIIESVLERNMQMIEDHNAQVIKPDQWPLSLGYGPWVEEIWSNYFSNAIKYGGEPPRVELGYDRIGSEMIRFWVQDNGPGLTEAQQTQLFQAFNRLNRTDDKGHGLGLSIVERIIQRLGGEVGVESTPGKGCRFYFTLQAAAETAGAGAGV